LAVAKQLSTKHQLSCAYLVLVIQSINIHNLSEP